MCRLLSEFLQEGLNLLLDTMGFESISVGVISQPRVTLLAQGMPFLRWGSLSLSVALQSLLSAFIWILSIKGLLCS